MSIVTQPLRTPDDTLEKACICIMSVERFMLNAWVILPFLFRVGIATTVMVFTQQQYARFHQDVHSKFSTTRNLHSCFHNQWIMILRLCLSWWRCVLFVWVLSRAGEQSIIGKMLLVHRAGLKSICVAPWSGLIRCFIKWENQRTNQHHTQYRDTHELYDEELLTFDQVFDNVYKHMELKKEIFYLVDQMFIMWHGMTGIFIGNVISIAMELETLWTYKLMFITHKYVGQQKVNFNE